MDLIKGYTKQPRSSPPKPRTDFSAFSSHPFAVVSSVSLLDSGSYGEGSSSKSNACSSSDFEEESNDGMECSLGRFGMPSDQRLKQLLDCNGLPVRGVGFAADNATLGSCKMRFSNSLMIQETSSAANLRSQDDDDDDGNLPCHVDRNQSNGWLHREEDALLPEDFLEARSLTHKQDSQCASQDISAKTSPILTRSKTSFLRKEKGNKKQKPNNNFLEVNKLLKSAKITRRSRIMQQLGLIAPTGSPF